MVVDIKKDVDIAAARFEDYPSPVSVQPNRLQVRVTSTVDVLIVDTGAGRVRLELDGPLHHLGVNAGRKLRQLQEKVLRQGYFGFEAHAAPPSFLLSSSPRLAAAVAAHGSPATRVMASSSRTTFQLSAAHSSAKSAWSGRSTTTFSCTHASSESAVTRPFASMSSNPTSGGVAPDWASCLTPAPSASPAFSPPASKTTLGAAGAGGCAGGVLAV